MGILDKMFGKKKIPPIVIRQNDGWAVFFRKSDMNELIRLYRDRPDAQPMSDNAVIFMVAAGFTEMPKNKQIDYSKQAHDGRNLVLEYKSAFDAINPQPSKEWDVPCYMVCLYDNTDKQRPNIVTYGKHLKVWIFAQPLNDALEAMWDKTDLIPPKNLIQSADAQMKLDGMLVAAVGETYTIDKLPYMTKEQRVARIQKEAGTSEWMCSALETELIRYNVVVMTT